MTYILLTIITAFPWAVWGSKPMTTAWEWYIALDEWLFFMLNIGRYTMHGSYGMFCFTFQSSPQVAFHLCTVLLLLQEILHQFIGKFVSWFIGFYIPDCFGYFFQQKTSPKSKENNWTMKSTSGTNQPTTRRCLATKKGSAGRKSWFYRPCLCLGNPRRRDKLSSGLTFHFKGQIFQHMAHLGSRYM